MSTSSETTCKLINESNGYQTYYDPATERFTRTHKESGRTFAWYARERPKKPVFKANNGVTVQIIEDAGHEIRVKHLRWALYIGQTERARRGRQYEYELHPICVPSTFRKDPMYKLLPKGGYTHISIKTPEGRYICVSSECSEEDPFCYQLGTVKALERLSREDIQLLQLGL